MNLKRIVKQSPLLLVTTALLTTGAADATNIFDPTVTNSTGINASSIELNATLFRDIFGANPWTINAFGGAGECLRFDVSAVTQNFDLELVVIGPDGQFFLNDDRVRGSDLRPLVTIDGARNSGWYTVHVADFQGRPIEGNFTLKYGRYPAGNVNCTGFISNEPPQRVQAR